MLLLLIFILAIIIGCSSKDNKNNSNPKKQITRKTMLENAKTWMYQIQGLDDDGAILKLAATDYPMLVVEPTNTIVGAEDFDTKAMVRRLKKTAGGKRRLVLAYIDIGEAEDYRTYWQEDWKAPTDTGPGSPDYIVAKDPDGWSGNYPVAYWDKRWKKIWLGPEGLISSLAKDGFDGIYLDWVEAYDDERIIEVAEEQGVTPTDEMVEFVKELKAAGQNITTDFLVIGQNAPYLLDENSSYANIIDALAVEDTWFSGEGDAQWDDPKGGDIANSNEDDWTTESLLKQYKKYLAAGIPVFSVDYILKEANAAQVYKDARKAGLRPVVTRVSLAKMTTTPPENF